MTIESVKWIGEIPAGYVEIIDQTRLPSELIILKRHHAEDIADDIKRLAVRGAPAIAIAAAFGLVLGIKKSTAASYNKLKNEFQHVYDLLSGTRPTAVNLFIALNRIKNRLESCSEKPVPETKNILLDEAKAILEEDKELCKRIAEYGQSFICKKSTIMTHCNTGALATGGTGTAISVILAAHKMGKDIRVYACETRPLLQGARLTVWELMQYGIDVTLIADSAASHVIKERSVNCIITGADRIAANGDTANKIGTYGLSVLSKAHKIPFYIAAPYSTFDPDIASGGEIIIEERPPDEIREFQGIKTAPPDASAYNPAFDVTPSENITAFITDRGVISPPYNENIKRIIK